MVVAMEGWNKEHSFTQKAQNIRKGHKIFALFA
jgi:hypothetical protein